MFQEMRIPHPLKAWMIDLVVSIGRNFERPSSERAETFGFVLNPLPNGFDLKKGS